MQKVHAWELLNDPMYSGRLGMVDLYNLIIRAGYPKDAANKAATQRGMDRLTAGELM